MTRKEIDCSREPYYIRETEENIFLVPKFISYEEIMGDWQFGYSDNSRKFILGENIVERQLDDLSIVVERRDSDEILGTDIIRETRRFAKSLGYDYASNKIFGKGIDAEGLGDNLYRVYPRLFRLVKTDSSSSAEKVWRVDIPPIRTGK